MATQRKTLITPDKAEPVMQTGVIPTISHLTAAQTAAATQDEVVTVTIPKNFKFTDDQHVVTEYLAGIDEMPLAHASHWYTKAMGVTIYKAK